MGATWRMRITIDILDGNVVYRYRYCSNVFINLSTVMHIHLCTVASFKISTRSFRLLYLYSVVGWVGLGPYGF